jgi:hypothetical protein
MIESVPFWAPTSPPLTGASSISMPFFSSSAATCWVARGETVLMSMTTAPRAAPCMTPSSPRITASMSGVSVTMVMMMSLAAATSRGVLSSSAPASTTWRTRGRSVRL